MKRVSRLTNRQPLCISGEAESGLILGIVLLVILAGAVSWLFFDTSPAPSPMPAQGSPSSSSGPTPPLDALVAVETAPPGEETGAAPGETMKQLIDERDRTRAASEALQITNALAAYFVEYRRYPEFGGDEPGSDTVIESDAELIRILTGNDVTRNPRKVRFFEPDPESLDDSGNLLDPWGNRYRVFIDTSYDNRITVDGKVRLGEVHVDSLGPESGR